MEKVNGSLALKENRVITIPAKEQPENVKLRVAAYARVSSSSEDQLHSYAAQNRYYTDLIAGNAEWQMVDIYADEGITGTSAEKRDDFQRLMADCHRGLVDRVLVKSISRFARNTKECLIATRELKSLGVSVYFEEQNIDTGKLSGEMLTALFAAFAQAESESISGNMRWSYKARMQSGTFITCKYPFGYRLNQGKLEIYEPEAKIVRMIFERFLAGDSCDSIAEYVTSFGIRTRGGKDRWQYATIRYILSNERYAGNAVLQKWYSTDTLPTKKKRNYGEKVQYWVSESNPPIVSQAVFDTATKLLEQKGAKTQITASGQNLFAKKIVCNHCGAMFRRKTFKGHVYWICRTHHSNKNLCPITQIPEEQIQSSFLCLYYKLRHQGIFVLNELVSELQTVLSRRMLWSKDIVALNREISDLYSQNQLLTQLKQQGLIDPDIFIRQSIDLDQQLRETKQKKNRLLDQEGDHTIQRTQELLAVLEDGPEFLDAFDGTIFHELVDKIIVESNDRIRFRLKNGLELAESIERTVR